MHARLFAFASPILVVLFLGTAGCDDNSRNDAPPRLVTAPSASQPRFVSVRPAAVRPEFVSGPSCRGLRPFRTRFNLFVHADRHFFLRGLGFEFRDRAGGRALPLPIPTTVTGPTIPNSVPVALPSAAPIPIPGTLPFNGVMFGSGIHGFGLVLDFGCGVTAEGMLSISVDTADGDGMRDVSHVSVPVR